MALQPGPDTFVVVVPEGTIDLGPLGLLRGAPIRPGVDSDHLVALDVAGNPIRIPWNSIAFGELSEGEAFVLETGEAWVTETGEAIIL